MVEAKRCVAGHSMTKASTMHRRKHGVLIEECRECVRLSAKKRNVYGYTRGEQVELAKHEVEVEDTSNYSCCPRCEGILRWGDDTRLDDLVSCVYCGWRPSARVGLEGNTR